MSHPVVVKSYEVWAAKLQIKASERLGKPVPDAVRRLAEAKPSRRRDGVGSTSAAASDDDYVVQIS